MKLIIDAQISPHFAPWISQKFGLPAESCRHLGMLRSTDHDLFMHARNEKAIVITKDEDFIRLLNEFGSPPKVIWVTCGNTSNAKLKMIFEANFHSALKLLEENDLVEIAD